MRSVGRVSSFGSVLVRQPPQKNSYVTRGLKKSVQAFITYTSSSKLSNNRNCSLPISTYHLVLVQKINSNKCKAIHKFNFQRFQCVQPFTQRATRAYPQHGKSMIWLGTSQSRSKAELQRRRRKDAQNIPEARPPTLLQQPVQFCRKRWGNLKNGPFSGNL